MSTPDDLGGDPVPAALGASRDRVLTALRATGVAVTVTDMSAATGLHPNTARFHLDGLVGLGLAERHVEERARRGRPRVLYTARPEVIGPRKFRLLASVLAQLVRRLDADGDAVVQAGREWARELSDGPAAVTAEESLHQLEQLMDRVGFEPELAGTELAEPGLVLHRCPFLEVAAERSDVVCALHRGLIEGALADGPVRLGELRPFATPDTCVARLLRR